jgi:hypothetical protein
MPKVAMSNDALDVVDSDSIAIARVVAKSTASNWGGVRRTFATEPDGKLNWQILRESFSSLLVTGAATDEVRELECACLLRELASDRLFPWEVSRRLKWRMRTLWLSLSVLLPISSGAVEIYDRFPDSIHASERYVIYSHGMIVEGDDPKPISPKYGQYDFPAIKQALFYGGGFNLIAYQRPKSLDDTYADTLKSWVRRLLDAGVKPSRDYAGWVLSRRRIDRVSL